MSEFELEGLTEKEILLMIHDQMARLVEIFETDPVDEEEEVNDVG